jgi:hypothetical protein
MSFEEFCSQQKLTNAHSVVVYLPITRLSRSRALTQLLSMLHLEPTLPTSLKQAAILGVSITIFLKDCLFSNLVLNSVVLMGPEQNISVLQGQIDGVEWDTTGIGYGVRGSKRQDLTIRLEGT